MTSLLFGVYSASQRAIEQAYSRGGATISSLIHDATLLETRHALLVFASAIMCMNECDSAHIGIREIQVQANALLCIVLEDANQAARIGSEHVHLSTQNVSVNAVWVVDVYACTGSYISLLRPTPL